MLILHPATLLKDFMISNSFMEDFLGSLKYRDKSSANRDSLISSFPILIPFPFVLVLLLRLGIPKLY
jgi:hypothetical protein